MGALHQGHLSLARTARSQSDVVVVSIFVNPRQFGPKEDFSKYPRSFEQDSALLQAEKVDYIFAPSVEEMYPQGATSWVKVEEISDRLDGRSRPGHISSTEGAKMRSEEHTSELQSRGHLVCR